MQTFLIIVHIMVTIGLIALILIQKSEGGGLVQSSSGSGLMSTRSTANLLTRTTAIFAALFMGLCLLEAIVAKHGSKPATLVQVSQTITAPEPAVTPTAPESTKAQEPAKEPIKESPKEPAKKPAKK